MATEPDPLRELRLSDVMTLLTVRRLCSMAAAARELSVTPSQVSKAIARLESQLGLTLLTRTVHGVDLTEPGRRIAGNLEALVQGLRTIRHEQQKAAPILTIAASSYLHAAVLPSIIRKQPE